MPGRAAAQRPGDGVGRVAQLGRGLPHAGLRLGGGLDAAQGVADGGGREAGVLGELADGCALAPGHAGDPRRCG